MKFWNNGSKILNIDKNKQRDFAFINLKSSLLSEKCFNCCVLFRRFLTKINVVIPDVIEQVD